MNKTINIKSTFISFHNKYPKTIELPLHITFGGQSYIRLGFEVQVSKILNIIEMIKKKN